jgi:hypothetical protein
MAFDVSKFLALTALIASTGAACSSTDKDKATPGGGGSPAAGTSGSAGQPGGQAGAADAGNGGAAAGNAGEGGAPVAGGVGGESLGGAGAGGVGGAGGADAGECLGSLAVGGAGGADAGVEPSLEGLCMDFFDTVCAGSEDFAPSYTVCEGVKERGQPAVAVAVADCIKTLSAEDACDDAKVAACFTGLEGKGCANPDAASTCASIKTNCAEVNLASCEKIADLVSPDMYEGFTGCMDPTDEGWYDPGFVGTCVERLDNCAGLRL